MLLQNVDNLPIINNSPIIIIAKLNLAKSCLLT